MDVFWVVSPCSLVVYQRFRGTCCLALLMETASTSDTVVNFYQTTRRYNPEDSHLRNFINWSSCLKYIYLGGDSHLFHDVLVCGLIQLGTSGNRACKPIWNETSCRKQKVIQGPNFSIQFHLFVTLTESQVLYQLLVCANYMSARTKYVCIFAVKHVSICWRYLCTDRKKIISSVSKCKTFKWHQLSVVNCI
jgi:hypothetical protein